MLLVRVGSLWTGKGASAPRAAKDTRAASTSKAQVAGTTSLQCECFFFFFSERGSLIKGRHVPTPSYSMGPAGKSCTAGLPHRTAPTRTAPRCCGCKWRSRACTASTAVAHNETYSWGPPQAQKKKRVSTAIPFETTPKGVPKPEKSRIFCSPKADNSLFSLSPARPAEKAHHVPAQHVLRGQKGIYGLPGTKNGIRAKGDPFTRSLKNR